MTEFDGLPILRSPIAIAAFEGWNDAADAASAAIEHLEQVWEAKPVAELDPDDYYDFQVTRPIVSISDEGVRHIDWPTTRMSVASPPGSERDIVLIRGIEPNMRWRAFCDDILELCHALDVDRLVLLGALLADVPYARALPVSGTTSGAADLEQLNLSVSRYQGPTGIVGVLHETAAHADVEVLSFWAHVPHYASNPPCPKATLALLHRIEEALDLPVPTADLAEDSAEWEQRVASLAEQDPELAEYISQLDQRTEEEGLRPLSGDEIAREFERYLRRRGGPSASGGLPPQP